jgi:hypothetical protein
MHEPFLIGLNAFRRIVRQSRSHHRSYRNKRAFSLRARLIGIMNQLDRLEGWRAGTLLSASTSSPVSRPRRSFYHKANGLATVAGLPVAVGLYTGWSSITMVTYALWDRRRA